MLLELFNPETVNADDFHRNVFMWYSRYDVMAGLLAGNETILSREWYTKTEEVAMQRLAQNPDDLIEKMWAWQGLNRRYAMDMASAFAKAQRGYITLDQFWTENEKLVETLDRLENLLESMRDPRYVVKSYAHAKPLGPDDIVNPYLPGGLYSGPAWDVNVCHTDLMGAKLMHKYQTGLLMQQPDFAGLRDMALEICRVTETVHRWPGRPDDYAVGFQSGLGLAALFLPHDEKHIMWCRRKMALIEQQG